MAKRKKSKPIKIYVDGSSSKIDSCICMIVQKGVVQKGLRKQVVTLPRQSIQLIEYEAVILALRFLLKVEVGKPGRERVILTDSLQIYNEINEIKPASSSTGDLLELVNSLLVRIPNVSIKKVGRDKNLAGLYLEARLEKVKQNISQAVAPRRFKA